MWWCNEIENDNAPTVHEFHYFPVVITNGITVYVLCHQACVLQWMAGFALGFSSLIIYSCYVFPYYLWAFSNYFFYLFILSCNPYMACCICVHNKKIMGIVVCNFKSRRGGSSRKILGGWLLRGILRHPSLYCCLFLYTYVMIKGAWNPGNVISLKLCENQIFSLRADLSQAWKIADSCYYGCVAGMSAMMQAFIHPSKVIESYDFNFKCIGWL